MPKKDRATLYVATEPLDDWNTRKNGEQRLACAVLQRCLCDAMMMNAESGVKRADTATNRRFKEDALRWMMEPGVRGEYTFSYLCEVIGIDEETVWKKVHEHEKKPVGSILALGLRKEKSFK